MSANQGQSTSAWMSVSRPAHIPLSTDVSSEVCIVGAGIAGLTTAYLLAREGRSVVVLDDGSVGGGQTVRTTAHLSNAIDDRYDEIERMHGVRGAQLAAESHTAAIDRIERIATDEGIECDFERVDGYLFSSPEETSEALARELDAAHRAGLTEVVQVSRAPIGEFDTGPALRFPRQAQFHPLKYLHGVADAIVRNGGRIFSGAHVTDVTGGVSAMVRTATGSKVTADAVVVATNTPINDLVAVHTKQAPYMSYVLGVAVPRGAIAPALFWDTEDPYHYVRTHRQSEDHDLLIVGGEDHKTGQADDADDRYARLETWARQRFPMIESVTYRWSGQVMETQDGLAFIGRNPLDADNVFVATGDSGMGMTHGTIAGILLTDLIMARDNPWESLYDPRRRTLRAASTWIRENANVAQQYADWIAPGDLETADSIAPGTGAIVRRGLTKIACYRDESGHLHEMSAACPHLGCPVDWNSSEHTWDCPCHGSRFDRLGTVISGPAVSNLKHAAEAPT